MLRSHRLKFRRFSAQNGGHFGGFLPFLLDSNIDSQNRAFLMPYVLFSNPNILARLKYTRDMDYPQHRLNLPANRALQPSYSAPPTRFLPPVQAPPTSGNDRNKPGGAKLARCLDTPAPGTKGATANWIGLGKGWPWFGFHRQFHDEPIGSEGK